MFLLYQVLNNVLDNINHLEIKAPKFFKTVCVTFVLLGFIGALNTSLNLQVFGSIPTLQELKEYKPKVPSELYTYDNYYIGAVRKQNREFRPLEDFPKHLINALLVTEDIRFYEHDGIDYRSLLRVLFKTILLNKRTGGGSTLTQQVAKNLYPRTDYALIFDKLREWKISKKLEKCFTKDEILSIYLNDIPFGGSAIGAAMSSKKFFSKDVKDLNIRESATIVAMLASNNKFNPRKNPQKSLLRRNMILKKMYQEKFITEYEYGQAISEPIMLKYDDSYKNDGFASHYKQLVIEKAKKLIEAERKPNGDPYNIYTDNLKIICSIEKGSQESAEKAVDQSMYVLQTNFDNHWKGGKFWKDDNFLYKAILSSKRIQSMNLSKEDALQYAFTVLDTRDYNYWTSSGIRTESVECTVADSVKNVLRLLNCGFMTISNKDDRILSWVGGIDWQHSQYDNVLSTHQIGSTFKPFLYLSAISEGVKPCEYISNQKVAFTIDGIKDPSELDKKDLKNPYTWIPKNSENDYSGEYSLQGALSSSLNVVSSKLIYNIGVKPVIQTCKKLDLEDVGTNLSIALGVNSFSLYKIVQAYKILATNVKKEPIFIHKIITSDNKLLYMSKAQNSRSVFDEDNLILLRYMMQSVVKNGTAQRLSYKNVAAKTGTTQNNADGWFVGYTPDYTFGVWVGAVTPLIHFKTLQEGQASRTALPVVDNFMRLLYAHEKYKNWKINDFPELNEQQKALLDCPPKRVRSDEIEKFQTDSLLRDTLIKKSFFEKLFNW